MKDLKILNFFTPLPIHFQLNLNTNHERVNSLIVCCEFFQFVEIVKEGLHYILLTHLCIESQKGSFIRIPTKSSPFNLQE